MSRGIRRGYSLPYIAPYDVDTGAYSTGMPTTRSQRRAEADLPEAH